MCQTEGGHAARRGVLLALENQEIEHVFLKRGINLAIDGTADDCDLLDGLDSSAFAAAAHGHSVGSLSDVTLTAIGDNELLWYFKGSWLNRTLAEAGIAASSHDHAGVYLPVAGQALMPWRSPSASR